MLDVRKLSLRKKYRLSRPTQLMPILEPRNAKEVWDSLAKIKELPVGTGIRIVRRAQKRGIPWYQVQAMTPEGDTIGTGWVNSIALIGQDIIEWEPAK